MAFGKPFKTEIQNGRKKGIIPSKSCDFSKTRLLTYKLKNKVSPLIKILYSSKAQSGNFYTVLIH